MEFLIPGLCGLVVIVGLVAVVMSRANWSIPQMVLVGFILIGSVVFFYFSARTFVLAKNWNDELKNWVIAIDQVENGKSQGTQIVDPGIEQLKQDRTRAKHDIDVALAGHGREWHATNVKGGDEGQITANVDDPTPHGIEPKTTLFVFDHRDIGFTNDGKPTGGKYIGEFTVSYAKDGDKQIKMRPSLPLPQTVLTEISRATDGLDLYQIMPVDSHSLFAQLDNRSQLIETAFPKGVQPEYSREAQLRARSGPAGSFSELVFSPAKDDDPKDSVYLWVKFKKEWSSDKVPAEIAAAPAAPAGTPAAVASAPEPAPAPAKSLFKPDDVALFDRSTAEDLVDKKIAELETNRGDKGKVFVRELRDYAQLFREATRRRIELIAQIDEVTAQAKLVTEAKIDVMADVAAIKKERTGLKSDLAKFQAERETVAAFVASVEKRNEQLRVELSQTFRANIRMAAELDQLNRQLQQEIIRRNPPVQSQASLAAPNP
jgi:hypothetical protein